MDFTARRRKIHKSVVSDNLSDLYPHDLNMYTNPPGNTISLNEFEDIALERLQLFRIIEQGSLKGHKLYSENWKSCINEDLLKSGLKKFQRLISGSCTNNDLDYQARRIDHISHFILRIAYCRSEDLRRWFLNRELEWFRLKFMAQSPESIKKFLQLNNFTYTPISIDEKLGLREELISSTAGGYNFENAEFYKVPFTDVWPLVKNRKVFVKLGFAYIHANELVVSVQSKFRASLSQSLNIYYRRLPLFDDDRIDPLLSNLHNLHTGSNYYTVSADRDSIDPANLDLYSKKHFPLCMRHMHQSLRNDHHLKHHARLQYGLFLKGIGLLYEDAVSFWKEEFTKKIDSNKFDKQYLYNIKHQYGKVGRMLNYSSYSCIKIIGTSVGPGDNHGCPFKHWDPTILYQKIVEYGLSAENAKEIKELVTGHHYQVACGKYFEYTHGRPPINGINHPNQYFEDSMNMEKENSENKK